MDASRSRLKIQVLYRRIDTLLNRLLLRSPLFAASLYEQKSRCGKLQCKCATSDYRHRQWCVSFVDDGQSRTHVVPMSIRSAVRRLTTDFRRFRRDRRALQQVLEQLLVEVAAVGAARMEEGKQHYRRLRAEGKKRGQRNAKKGGR